MKVEQQFDSLLNTLSPQAQYKILFKTMHNICATNNWGDPFSYARSREIFMSHDLNHTIADTYSGEDAFIIDNNTKIKFEYKSTIQSSIQGNYSGISVKDTLDEQIKYVTDEKIGCYHSHYFSRFENGDIAETWEMQGDQVLKLLLPKIVKKFNAAKSAKKQKADPRIAVTLSKTEITKFGTRIK